MFMPKISQVTAAMTGSSKPCQIAWHLPCIMQVVTLVLAELVLSILCIV